MMKAAIILFPGTNREQNMAFALGRVMDIKPTYIWHKETDLGNPDLVVLAGGFSYGDYLRCGAMAAHAPIMHALRDYIAKGGYVLGVCNGFQILTEMHILPGALLRNKNMRFLSGVSSLRVENAQSAFTCHWQQGDVFNTVLAHGEGNYMADPETLAHLHEQGRIAFRYVDAAGVRRDEDTQCNPNGSVESIAGILSENKRVLGMMPHPEDLVDPLIGGTDGIPLFAGLKETINR